ncbi:MAG: four helix bundle protein, partial [Bacteroidetes bacterium]|nr:four helix bundle protein [Bacteroidota bacterium]
MVNQIYENSNGFPESEKFGLITQIRRCTVSIPSNIADGCGRGTNKDFNYFLSVSLGSSFELETQLILAHDLGFLDSRNLSPLLEQVHEIQKMIIGLQSVMK